MLMNFSPIVFMVPEHYLSCDELQIADEIKNIEETEEELCLI